MKRRVGLIALFTLLMLAGIHFGPVLIRLLSNLGADYRAMRELARRERYYEQHPPELPFATRYAQVFLATATASAVRVFRIAPEPDSACATRSGEDCFQEHHVLHQIPVDGTRWGHTFLLRVLQFATETMPPANSKPDFGIRFLGRPDTVDVLLDTTEPGRFASRQFRWRASGRVYRAYAHMAYVYAGDPGADSTLARLKILPIPVDTAH